MKIWPKTEYEWKHLMETLKSKLPLIVILAPWKFHSE